MSQRERVVGIGGFAVLVLILSSVVTFAMRSRTVEPEVKVVTVLGVKDFCFNRNCFQEINFQRNGRYKVVVPKSEALVQGERIELLVQCPPRGSLCSIKYKGRELGGK